MRGKGNAIQQDFTVTQLNKDYDYDYEKPPSSETNRFLDNGIGQGRQEGKKTVLSS